MCNKTLKVKKDCFYFLVTNYTIFHFLITVFPWRLNTRWILFQNRFYSSTLFSSLDHPILVHLLSFKNLHAQENEKLEFSKVQYIRTWKKSYRYIFPVFTNDFPSFSLYLKALSTIKLGFNPQSIIGRTKHFP